MAIEIEIDFIVLEAKSGSPFTVPLGDTVATLTPRYNHSSGCWSLDIADAQGVLLVAGLMLIPNVDILEPYQQLKRTLGSIVLLEKNVGDYRISSLLGTQTKLAWFRPGAEIVLV